MKEQSFVTWREIKIRVFFDHQPEEKQTQTYPGCPASIEITTINFEDSDMTPTWQEVDDWIKENYGEDLQAEAMEHME